MVEEKEKSLEKRSKKKTEKMRKKKKRARNEWQRKGQSVFVFMSSGLKRNDGRERPKGMVGFGKGNHVTFLGQINIKFLSI